MITLTKDRYETLGHLGSGASSRVDKARDNVIGRTVALKTFLNDFGPGLEQQFLREAQIIGQLSNPSIVQLYDVGINERGIPFLVMEYVAGKTLEDHLDPSALPLQRACAWAADLAGALALAHRAGIIHGDVKPGNILVTAENKVKLGDFGIARFASQSSGSGNLRGTPAYLAPEQIQGEPQDPRSDQFALGIVLYQMVSGVKPFDGSSLGAVCAQILNAEPVPPSRHNPSVPKALDRIIARGGFITAPTGSAEDANATLVPKENADLAFDAATCIGCGACVAACPNASASLFTAAKVGHLGLLPQGQPERWDRVLGMTEQMDAEGFGGCTFHGECEAACPKGISVRFIAQMNADYLRARLRRGRRVPQGGDDGAG
jgi:serine/threonine protein kinase